MLFLFVSFMAEFAKDEGMLGQGVIRNLLPKLFTILRFPLHSLFFDWVIRGGSSLFIGTLVFNCFFWALLAERVLTLCFSKSKI